MNSSQPKVVNESSSNVVLYAMLMRFRGEAIAAQDESLRMRQLLEQQQEQLHQLTIENRNLVTANVRGANLVNMKHEAGLMFGQCTDRFTEICGVMRREIPEVTAFVPELERIVLRADFAHHMLHGINYVDLTADDQLDEDTEVDTDDDEEIEL